MANSGGLTTTKRDAGLQLKTTEFSGFLRALKEKLGDKTDMRTIVDYEMGRVLNRSLALTGAASEEKIKERWRGKRVITLLGKKQVLVNPKTGRAQKFPDATWELVKRERAAGIARTLAKIGISKATWAALAEKLGQEITVPAYVRAAGQRAGISRYVSIERRETGPSYGVAIINGGSKLTYSPPAGREALFTAFAGRIGFYRKNMAEGVFDSIHKIAAKYKGLVAKKG